MLLTSPFAKGGSRGIFERAKTVRDKFSDRTD
jgi:hypothetical protein